MFLDDLVPLLMYNENFYKHKFRICHIRFMTILQAIWIYYYFFIANTTIAKFKVGFFHDLVLNWFEQNMLYLKKLWWESIWLFY
jgi:hypothetical protein